MAGDIESRIPGAVNQVITSAPNLPITAIATATTGTGKVVLQTSPTLITPVLGTVTSGVISACTSTSMVMVTPVLGTPTSGTLTTCTGLPEAGLSLTDITTANVTTSAHGFAPKAPNDATKFLDGTGVYSVPAQGAGELVLISSQTAAASASLDFTSLSAASYNGYWIVLTNVLSAGTTGGLALRISIATVFQAGGTYVDVAAMCRSGGVTSSGSTADTQIFVTGTDAVGSAAGTSEVSGTIFIPNCSQTTAPKRITFQTMCKSQAGNNNATTGGGYFPSNSAVDGFRIFNSGFNLTSGTVALYGIKNT